MDVFKNRLKELRLNKGISINKLAKAIGVQAATISYYENGKRIPSLRHLTDLCSYFNVNIDYLCGKDLLDEIDSLTIEERLSIILNEHPTLYEYIIEDPRNNIKELEKIVLNLKK